MSRSQGKEGRKTYAVICFNALTEMSSLLSANDLRGRDEVSLSFRHTHFSARDKGEIETAESNSPQQPRSRRRLRPIEQTSSEPVPTSSTRARHPQTHAVDLLGQFQGDSLVEESHGGDEDQLVEMNAKRNETKRRQRREDRRKERERVERT